MTWTGTPAEAGADGRVYVPSPPSATGTHLHLELGPDGAQRPAAAAADLGRGQRPLELVRGAITT